MGDFLQLMKNMGLVKKKGTGITDDPGWLRNNIGINGDISL